MRSLIFSFLLCFLLAASIAWAAPNPDFGKEVPGEVADNLVQTTLEDCHGAAQQGSTSGTSPCQDYNSDLYESIDYDAGKAESADIKTLKTGYDNVYYYFEVDFVNPWSVANSTGHSISIEFDVDADVESGRGDYYISIYQKEEFNKSSWQDAKDHGGYEAYVDANNDVGGNNTSSPDSGNSDGYESDVSQDNNKVWARIINGNFQLAIHRSLLGTDAAYTRVWSRQSTSLPKDKVYFHDQNPSDAIKQIDNLCGLPIHENCGGVGPALEPTLTVVKSADTSVAAPGATITYTVLVSSTAAGGEAENVVVIDDLSPYAVLSLDAYGTNAPFQFSPGSSGLTMETPLYSNNDGTSFSYSPTGPFDNNITDVRIPMAGVMSNGETFTLEYQVQVK
ncbi:DUF11 domain-containing protein [Thalassotalea sp. ND16A]|uniref:DUF11 domain-containing protein n=1 Tax=Thalassotalea sp. ND16A TaxID=1535422 RepID=UPI001363A2DE|nr:DUF11 domain-containing protein [Thalassotalea sp. ND16A]